MKEYRLFCLSLVVLPLGVRAIQRPNIIYIMCDDMGYGDLGCYGQKLIETPHIDKMAREGMRFTQAYAGSPVSAPSRACFMTGQHSGHTHVRGNREYWPGKTRNNMFGNCQDFWIVGQEPYLMTHPILPELLHQAGYTVGMFGKWAGGYWNYDHPNEYAADDQGNTDTNQAETTSSLSLPHLRGIDCFYGPICQFQAHSYYPNFLNRYDPALGDTHIVAETMEQNIRHATVASGDTDYEQRSQYSAELIHQRALEWIDRQAQSKKPFFGIFTYTLPHAELWQPRDEILQHYTETFQGEDSGFGGQFGSWYYRNSNRHAQFAAMITRLDKQVGEIRAKLKEKGLDKNTLIIFTSDNGPHEEGGADPDWFNRDGLLKGKKRSTHEGGIRVPFIACGPHVPAGTVNDHQLAFYDLMPTLLDYVGKHKAAKTHSLKGSTPDAPFDGISFYHTLTGRDSKQQEHDFLYWEFHETNMMGLRMGDWKLVVKNGHSRLYDLSQDIHEDHDVALLHPDVVERMKQIIREQHVPSPIPDFGIQLPDANEEN